jgi:hypothetical protein
LEIQATASSDGVPSAAGKRVTTDLQDDADYTDGEWISNQESPWAPALDYLLHPCNPKYPCTPWLKIPADRVGAISVLCRPESAACQNIIPFEVGKLRQQIFNGIAAGQVFENCFHGIAQSTHARLSVADLRVNRDSG